MGWYNTAWQQRTSVNIESNSPSTLLDDHETYNKSGQAVLQVISTAGFGPGRPVTITDDAHSETGTVLSITSATILTLTGNLANSYTEANNAKLYLGPIPNYSAMFDAYYNCCPIESDSCTQFHYRPAARYAGTHDRTYIAGVNYAGVISVRCWDEDALTLGDPQTLWTIGSYDHDDHAGCSVIVLQHQTGDNAAANGTVLVVASHGFGLDYMASRRSDQTSDTGVTSWGEANLVTDTDADDAAYPQLVETSDGTIWLFMQARGADGVGLEIYYSILTIDPAEPDNDVWSDCTLFADLPKDTSPYEWTYAKIWGDGADIYVTLMRTYHDVFFIKYDGTGAHWETIDGTVKTLPLDESDGDHTPETVYASAEAPAYKSAAIWDIKTDPSTHAPHILFYVYDLFTAADQTSDLYHAYWDGDSWEVVDTGINGVAFGTGTLWLNSGAELDQDDMHKLFASVPDGSSNAQIQAYVTTDYSASSWALDTDVCTDGKITQSSPGDNFRPIHVLDGAGHFKLLWFYSEHYNFATYLWSSMRFAYPGFNNQHFIGFGKACRTDFEDVIFTSSNGQSLLGDEGHPWQQEETDSWRSVMWIGKWTCPVDDATTTLYCYYGNATNTFSPDQTTMDSQFLACDHFDEEYSDAVFDAHWTTVNEGAAISTSALVLTSTTGTRGEFRQNTANYPLFTYGEIRARWKASDTTPGAAYVIGAYESPTAEERATFIPGGILNNASAVACWTNSDTNNTATNITADAVTTYHIYAVRWFSSSLCTFHTDDSALITQPTSRLLGKLLATHTTNVSDEAQGLALKEGSTASTGTVSVDWIFARALTTEPTITVAAIREYVSQSVNAIFFGCNF